MERPCRVERAERARPAQLPQAAGCAGAEAATGARVWNPDPGTWPPARRPSEHGLEELRRERWFRGLRGGPKELTPQQGRGGGKTTPRGLQRPGAKSYWHRGGGPAPGRGLQGGGVLPGSGAGGLSRVRSSHRTSAPGSAEPAADMCAARTPPLAHIFRGTFVHSTWTCPMQVLRDHLLGVSDSGKVSRAGALAGARAAGRARE